MRIYDSPLYQEDIRAVAGLPLPWERLQGKSVLISGATGMIGRFLIDVLACRNRTEGMDCKVYALGRSEEKARARFSACWDASFFSFAEWQLTDAVTCGAEQVDFVLHFASNTHPRAYAEDPIGTITANIHGTQRLLDFACAHGAERFLFASSVEIYGKSLPGQTAFRECDCGYIDCNTLRAGYPESKRAGEALCQAYLRQKGIDVVIPRLARTYGPTLLASDTKALTQFLHNGVRREDIVLKSAGTQLFSYCYVADTVGAILWCLLLGGRGEAYNVADPASDIRLRDLAQLIADESGTRVVFDLPDETERAGYSTADVAVLDSAKLRALDWHALYDIRGGVTRTLAMLRDTE